MKPKDVKRYSDIFKLKRDNVSTKKSWIIFNSQNELVIANQIVGQNRTGEIKLSRREFQKFVDWWNGI